MIIDYIGIQPKMADSCFIAENASVIGKVIMEEDSSIWFHTVVRGDSDQISIGKSTNIQDNCTLHTDLGHTLTIKDYVSVGHNAILHGAYIEDECLIGMGAIILNGAHIGKHSIVGAGAVVKENQIVPENSIVVGCPAKVVKQISQEQIKDIIRNAQHYVALAKQYQGK